MHPHCQQDQVSHRPLRQPSDADLLLVWPLLLLLSPRHRHGLFAGDGRLPNWLQLLRPSRLTWIAKREAVRLPSRLQFIDRLGRPGLRNAKLFGFPPGCSFLDREHDLRKILIRQQIHSKKFLVAKQQLITCLTDRNDSPLRWRSLRDWVYMNSHDCILCRSSSSCCVSSCEDRMRSTSLRACVCSRLSPARLSACRRRSCSLLRSSLSSAVKVGRLVLRDSMGASKLDLWRIRFSTIRKVNTPREGKL